MSNVVDDLLDGFDDIKQSSPVQQAIISKKDAPLLTDEKLLEYVSKAVEVLMDKMGNDFGKAAVVTRALFELKKAWWPATQKQITTNIDVFNEQLKAWYIENEAHKKLEEERIKNIQNEQVTASPVLAT